VSAATGTSGEVASACPLLETLTKIVIKTLST